MRRSLSNSSRVAGLGLAMTLLTAGCVNPGPPSVGMSTVEASLVFGLEEEAPQPVTSPIQETVSQLVAAPAPADEPVEQAPIEFEFAKPRVPLLRSPSSSSKPACPTAPVTAAAEVATQPRISGDVPTGTSKWRLTGFTTSRAGDQVTRNDFGDTSGSPRSVRNVTEISDTRYSFEVVEAGSSAIRFDETEDDRELVTVTTYEVNTAGLNVNPSDGVGTVATPGVGEPERGIVLSKIERVDPSSGQVIDTFAPTIGLLVLPLPVVAGETFVSTAVDPRTGQTISHDSVVKGRERIDACGDLVDGWLVESKRRETGSGGAVGAGENLSLEIVYSQIFATQYGGIPILERSAYPAEDCAICPFEFTQRLGQLTPDPLTTG